MTTFVADVLESIQKRKNPWLRWFERLGEYYDKRLGGKDWREKDKEFWDKRSWYMDYM